MPVRKFRSAAEMPPAAVGTPRGPGSVALACRLSDLAVRLKPRRFPPGLYRYGSVEAASRARERWERQGAARPPGHTR